MNRFRTSATLSTLLIVLVACGPAASSFDESAGAASADGSKAPTSGGDALPSFTEGAVADLEAWIPDTVAGVKMGKVSMRGGESLLQFDDEAIGTLLQDLSVSESDVSLAVGIGYSAEFNFSARMFVFRAAGVDSGQLEAAFKQAIDSGRDTPLNWIGTNTDGKQIDTAADGDSTNYLYVKGDVLVFMFASNPDIAAAIISRLP